MYARKLAMNGKRNSRMISAAILRLKVMMDSGVIFL